LTRRIAARPGASEIELFGLAHVTAQERAGAPVELVCQVTVGAATADVAPPVCEPGPRRMQAGDPVLADVAIRHRGYWGDTTRTLAAPGDDEVAEVRAGLERILAASGASLRPGLAASAVHAAMRRAIERAFPQGVFPHHGGHGLGVAVGEDPQLVPSEPLELEAGMVLAVEPGVYFPAPGAGGRRFGVRVEDVFVVTADGGVEVTRAR
jgi:Xaa-Pro aminopeptidase